MEHFGQEGRNKEGGVSVGEQGPRCARTLQAGWHHSSGAPWSSFSTLSGCHVQGLACMCSNQASLNSWGRKGDRFRSLVWDSGAQAEF